MNFWEPQSSELLRYKIDVSSSGTYQLLGPNQDWSLQLILLHDSFGQTLLWGFLERWNVSGFVGIEECWKSRVKKDEKEMRSWSMKTMRKSIELKIVGT